MINQMTKALSLLALTLLMACKGSSVDNLYKFPATKDVQVQVNIDYKLDAGGGPPIALANENFLLNAFLAQDAQLQVALGIDGQTPTVNLPITLTATHMTLNAVARVPVAAQAGADGYTLHFTLTPVTSSLYLDGTSTTTTNLDALKGGIQPGTGAASNSVELSLATTVAYNMVGLSSFTAGSAEALTAYATLTGLVQTGLTTVEGNISTTSNPDLSTFTAAVLAVFKYNLTKDQTAQAKLVTALQPTGGDVAAESQLSNSFTQLMKTYITQVKSALGSASTAESAIVKPNVIDIASIPDPANYVSVVFAPAAVTFTDTDTTTSLGGNIVISPPSVATGITSYNVYFGGSTAATRQLKLLGSVAAAAGTLQYVLAKGTAISSGATMFWVYPVASGKELDVPTGLTFVNVIGTTPVAAPPTPLNLVDTPGSRRVLSAWTSGGGSTAGYLLVRRTSANPTWVPTNGQTYTAGQTVGDSVVVYVGTALSAVDLALDAGTYHDAVFASSSAASYSAAAFANATVVTDLWTWYSGTQSAVSDVVRGTKGTPATDNTPESRASAAVCRSGNNTWLFGGNTDVVDRMNDLWRFDGTNWTWMTGGNGDETTGVYGTKGVAAVGNSPGGRDDATCVVDSLGNLWLFGGHGADATQTDQYLQDLWKFDGTSWTWVSGPASCDVNCIGTYGTKGVAAPGNIPSGRYTHRMAIDGSNHLWVFGGLGNDSTATTGVAEYGRLDDLWRFDGTAWAWMGGTGINSTVPNFGTLGTAASGNNPGSMDSPALAADSNNNVWLFGGNYSFVYNALWRFDGSNWAWIAGSNTANSVGVYGPRGTAGAGYTPGGRMLASLWTDQSNQVWLYGGTGNGLNTSSGSLGDLWKFNGTSWIYVAGTGSDVNDSPVGTIDVSSPVSNPGGRNALTAGMGPDGRIQIFGQLIFQSRRGFCLTDSCEPTSYDFWNYLE